jgi:hypothetical protein
VKKLAIGCLVVVVLFAVAGAVGAFFVYRAVRVTVIDPAASAIADLASFQSVPALERQVRNTADFKPPDSGLLTPVQINRLMKVQGKVRQSMGASFAELERRYKDLLAKEEATAADLPQIIAAYRDLAKLWLVGKKAQVDALNETNLSLSEYRWVRSRAYTALGLPLMSIDVSRLIEDAASGRQSAEVPGTLEGSVGPSGPPENQRLIEPFKKALADNAAMAVFGL